MNTEGPGEGVPQYHVRVPVCTRELMSSDGEREMTSVAHLMSPETDLLMVSVMGWFSGARLIRNLNDCAS